ncbi:MAG TPA: hypothetical protein VMD28_04210 [Acidimicrobiales bacterium]|nr:hypothetical protein [Acidimicrobiales bacterium]
MPRPTRPLVFIVIVAVTSLTLSTVAYARSPSVSSVIKTVKAAVRKESGAQLVAIEQSASSSQVAKETLNAGTTSGQETFSKGQADFTIKVTPTDAYISGSSSGLTTILGMSATDAKKIGSDWVYWKHGTTEYADLKSGLTVSSLTSVFPKVKGTTLSTRSTKGVILYVLRWTSAATSSAPKLSETLTVSTKTDLPVRSTATTSGGTKVATTFSDWGKRVLVSAPPSRSTVPSSKITG